VRHSQRGVAGVLIVLILVMVLVGFIASYALSRFTSSADDRQGSLKRLAAAQEALELYAARNMRLPCPASPTANTGDEVQLTTATCTFNQGTIPWNTIGLLREQGLDAWGRKIAYRVYTGNKGSLTQPRGVSMIECDTVEPSPEGTTSVAGSLGGLCKPDPPNTLNLGLRTTTPAEFLDGKGLRVKDGSADYTDVAYVLISHGQSGLGGFTSSGASVMIDDKTDPKGDELDNTKATGPFVIKPFSDAETSILANDHFDDFLVYRRLPELIARIKLDARDWPDPDSSNLSVRFDAGPVGTAARHLAPGRWNQSRHLVARIWRGDRHGAHRRNDASRHRLRQLGRYRHRRGRREQFHFRGRVRIGAH
jgi:type II secretory pathway pseudopilin PulG